MNAFRTLAVTEADRSQWRQLFDGYADFYGIAMDSGTAERVWRWLMDDSHALEGLMTRSADGNAVAIAHIRACPRPLGGCEIGFLDDLFVAPHARGSGAADALFEALYALAKIRGWPSIRWVTQHSNHRGRAFYDRYTGGPSDFIMYQWTWPPVDGQTVSGRPPLAE
ncbi:GNAT family N-acetyltransferase [Aquisalimonas sp.]|uniref:GNAT family N-acetyltransferase n=1 Tax=Aquisalimonas sp. TaxID=1872621 RepID=UPI0025BB7C8B|nr:GNAT family N-acetyltransferase [Aquisalimonas sp.]